MPREQQKGRIHRLWMLPLLGLCLASFALRCDARAVNVSNTWTMPQEGLNVFYRFFRDRISWFEADAVCQFHHANLVTVDNSFQFDATRDLLRELDVNDIVWIGLMRPQNSDRFMWSNSRPLVVDTGYWAESLPLMEAPLCAVIDPIRDYRWHALRCGGPETASFLCEMPVPSWADACILKEMPNLTMQYMADTASIELIRNCQEEGLLRHTCKGKEDRARAIRELICPKERLEAQRINDITNSHFKSLQIINNMPTDNNENNDIELLPMVVKYSKKAIKIKVAPVATAAPAPAPVERFSLDSLMMADAPVPMPMRRYQIPDQVPMPVKKSAKKVNIQDEYAKKVQTQQKQKPTPTPISHLDMMMGDQPPMSDEQLTEDRESDVSNEIFEALPHRKKLLQQDLRTMQPIVEATATAATEAEANEATEAVAAAAAATSTAAPATTTRAPATTAAAATTTQEPATSAPTTTTTAAPATTAGPPTTTAAAATTMAVTTTVASTTTTAAPTTTTTTTTAIKSSAAPAITTTSAPSTTTTTTEMNIKITTAAAAAAVPEVETDTDTTVVAATGNTSNNDDSNTSHSSSSISSNIPAPTTAAAMPMGTSTVSIAHPIHPVQQTRDEMSHPHVKETADNSHFIPPMLLVKSHYVSPAKHGEHGEHGEHGGEHGGEHVQHKAEHATTNIPLATTTAATTMTTTEQFTYMSGRQNAAAADEVTATAGPVAAVKPTSIANMAIATAETKETKATATTTAFSVPAATPTVEAAGAAGGAGGAVKVLSTEAPQLLAETATKQPKANENRSNATTAGAGGAAGAGATKAADPKMQLESESEAEDDDEPELTSASTSRHNFLQEETEAPFKPNRRRSLTKPETVSYFKKILG